MEWYIYIKEGEELLLVRSIIKCFLIAAFAANGLHHSSTSGNLSTFFFPANFPIFHVSISVNTEIEPNPCFMIPDDCDCYRTVRTFYLNRDIRNRSAPSAWRRTLHLADFISSVKIHLILIFYFIFLFVILDLQNNNFLDEKARFISIGFFGDVNGEKVEILISNMSVNYLLQLLEYILF